MLVLDFCMRYKDVPCADELCGAFSRIRRQERMGHECTCVRAWAQLAEHRPELVCGVVENWMVSTPGAQP